MAIPQRKVPAPRTQTGKVSPIQPAASPPARDQVAARAYELWQQAGRPDGQHEAHWYQAERELRTRGSR